MSVRQSGSAFDLVPESWFEPVVGLWVVVLAGFGMQMTVHHGQQLLRPLGTAPWAAVVVTVVVAVVAYGGFGLGLTHLYREYRDFEPRFVRQPLDADEWRWLAGLGALALILMGLGGVWEPRSVVVTPLFGFDLPHPPERMAGFTLGLAGVNDMVNQAPFVIFAAMLAGLLMGPAAGAVFHGILQDTVASVAPSTVTIATTVIITTIVAVTGTLASPTYVVAFGFVLGVAYAYRETENLVVVMAAYGLFNAFAFILAWVDILVSLSAAGHLFG